MTNNINEEVNNEEVKEIKYPYTVETYDNEGFKELKIYINDKGAEYHMREKPFRIFKNIQKTVTNQKTGQVNTGDMITKLISTSLIKPELKDNEIDELPTSRAMILTNAVAKLYNLKNLQEDFS